MTFIGGSRACMSVSFFACFFHVFILLTYENIYQRIQACSTWNEWAHCVTIHMLSCVSSFLLLQRWSCRCWSSHLNSFRQRRKSFGRWISSQRQSLLVKARDPSCLCWWRWQSLDSSNNYFLRQLVLYHCLFSCWNYMVLYIGRRLVCILNSISKE